MSSIAGLTPEGCESEGVGVKVKPNPPKAIVVSIGALLVTALRGFPYGPEYPNARSYASEPSDAGTEAQRAGEQQSAAAPLSQDNQSQNNFCCNGHVEWEHHRQSQILSAAHLCCVA
eukprot:2402937-Amphidinium_carterae.1